MSFEAVLLGTQTLRDFFTQKNWPLHHYVMIFFILVIILSSKMYFFLYYCKYSFFWLIAAWTIFFLPLPFNVFASLYLKYISYSQFRIEFFFFFKIKSGNHCHLVQIFTLLLFNLFTDVAGFKLLFCVCFLFVSSVNFSLFSLLSIFFRINLIYFMILFYLLVYLIYYKSVIYVVSLTFIMWVFNIRVYLQVILYHFVYKNHFSPPHVYFYCSTFYFYMF